MNTYRLRHYLSDFPIGWAVRIGPAAIVLIWGAKPRGLWLHPRAWLDGIPDNG